MTDQLRIRLKGDKVRYDGYALGSFGIEENSGEEVFVAWKNLFRIQNSYSFTIELFDKFSHVDSIYIIDKESDRMYKFLPKTYRMGKRVWANGQMQFAPDLNENCGTWESGSDKIVRW